MSAPPALVAVLAGGLSRRMGAPKALVRLGGEPLIARPLAAAAAAGLEAVVVAKPGSQLPPLGVEVWLEPETPVHPLVGLISVLERGRPVIAVACDMPFVTAGLLTRLAAFPGAAAPRVGGLLQPFPGRYPASALPVLRAALAREAPVRAALAELAPAELGEAELRGYGDPARLVSGINTPQELARAETLLSAAGRVSRRMPPTAEQWIEAFAAAVGRPAPTEAEVAALLELASVAAHASERRAAPIACWLAAASGHSLEQALAIAEGLPDEP